MTFFNFSVLALSVKPFRVCQLSQRASPWQAGQAVLDEQSFLLAETAGLRAYSKTSIFSRAISRSIRATRLKGVIR